MNFVFVDETGDPGAEISKGASPYFGMVSLSVRDEHYEAVRLLLAQIHWLCGTAACLELGSSNPIRALNLLRGLRELVRSEIISVSAMYIKKETYGGRYLTWSPPDVPLKEWRYYLRNYLLRHLLEFHFASPGSASEPVDLILDRVILTESQRKNTFDYLNSANSIPLRRKFEIPSIEFLTLADSEYVGGLEIAHVMADVLKEQLKETIISTAKEVADFMKIELFVGDDKPG
ncbi:MAG: hypothetical protein HYX84_04605 [Chloroflexi bacterium]|nr:hypothetical protein [Chloroflexota bacterium]